MNRLRGIILLAKLKKEIFKDKKVLVVGLARSGTGAANLLSLIGAEVSVTDIKPRYFLRDNIKKLLPSIKVIAGEHPGEIFNTVDMIVVSPGVPLNIPPVMRARSRGIPVIGELELAYQVIRSMSDRAQNTACDEPFGRELRVELLSRAEHRAQTTERGSNSKLATPAFIGVTGTNGKSTTTTLIDRMLRKSGFKTLLGGNIGNALTEEIRKALGVRDEGLKDSSPHASRLTPIDYIVTEVSSFQLESIRDFKPLVAVILNLTPDHLNRYSRMQEYINAKAGIFKNQGNGDCLVLNADDPVVIKIKNEKLEIRSKKSPKILFFSRKREVEGIYCKENNIYCSLLSTSKTAPSAFLRKQEEGAVSSPFKVIAIDEIRIKGVHNLENAMAASLTAIISGCPVEAVRSVLKDFSGLEHRLEFVCEIDGVSFINDSKGTNVGAVIKSIESLENIVLIMGGRDKDSDFAVLKDLIKEKVKTLILLGEAGGMIAGAIGKVTETIYVNSIEEAVKVSVKKASSGDVVLLSPGCASFDMFADFEERGRRFKGIVKQIQNSNFGVLGDL